MKRNAFTLVELLFVIVVIGLLAGMTSIAVSGVTNTANIARTKGIVAFLNDVVMTKYESYKTRPLPVIVPPSLSGEAARVRLLMIRDLMRMEMPDRKVDVTSEPMLVTAAVKPVIFNNANEFDDTQPLQKRIVDWFQGNADVPSELAGYRDRVPLPDLVANPSAGRYDAWTREWESAEALYLIVSTTFIDGIPAIEGIPSSNIGDEDGDGMLEIQDAWGTPIGFIRWPVDYVDSVGFELTDDEMDPFKVDFGFLAPNAPEAATGLTNADGSTRRAPFSLRPLVVSAGPDREFDLLFSYSDWESDPAGTNDIHFRDLEWPQSQMGADSAGHDAPYIYVDPYQRQFAAASGRLGAYADDGGDGDEQRVDNITNFELEARQ
jgi:prepilin-type N-terminal cleavage/methylation domain-containing protein